MKALTRKPPNPGLQRTALCAHKIGAILTVGFSPTVFPIYDCAAAEAQPVRPCGASAIQRYERYCPRAAPPISLTLPPHQLSRPPCSAGQSPPLRRHSRPPPQPLHRPRPRPSRQPSPRRVNPPPYQLSQVKSTLRRSPGASSLLLVPKMTKTSTSSTLMARGRPTSRTTRRTTGVPPGRLTARRSCSTLIVKAVGGTYST